MSEIRDTSADYDDMVGYIAEERFQQNLSEFIGEESEQRLSVKPKPVDKDFPEQWQTLFVNFYSFEDYVEFMNKIGKAPVPKLKSMVYEVEEDMGILAFFGDQLNDYR